MRNCAPGLSCVMVTQHCWSATRRRTYTKHRPGSMDHPMDSVHEPPLIFKRKSHLLIWEFTGGQDMKNTDSYFFINIPWLQICVRFVNFVCKIIGLFLCTIEYNKWGKCCFPDRIAIWKCWNENIGGRNTLDLLYLKMSLWSPYLWGCDPKAARFYKTNPQGRKQ